MRVIRVLRAQDGNIINRLRDFFAFLWSRVELEAMLAPVTLPGDIVASQVIDDPKDLLTLNPFAPVMQSNAASAVAELLQSPLKGPLVVMLRPCELRTLIELQKRHPDLMASPEAGPAHEMILTIGLDCPGTLPVDNYTSQVNTLGLEAITHQALASGAENGFLNGPLRKACQLCDWPIPSGADLTIGIFGVGSSPSLFVIAKDELTDAHLELAYSTDGLATEAEVSRRETTVKAISAGKSAWRDGLDGSEPPGTINSLLAYFARCSLCADCLAACPLYEGELTGMLGVGSLHQRERPLLAELIGVSRWLASCSGCGMCEEVCERDIPLTMLITQISQYMDKELHYVAGEPGQHLPWVTAGYR